MLVYKALIFFLQQEATDRIDAVYKLKVDSNPYILAVLLLLWIGPAEEIFWRGCIQVRFTRHFGRLPGLIVASAVYAAVHIVSGNWLLVFVAFVLGIFWGTLVNASGNLWMSVVSHGIWDALIFIIAPLS